MLPKFRLPKIDTGDFDFTGTGKTKTVEPYQPHNWTNWLRELFPAYVTHPFGPHHEAFWDWVDSLESGTKPRPFVALWPRGGAKSTSAELACVYLGARQTRSYVWYVSSTQEKADKHVQNIGGLLESKALERHNPALASRKVGKYGHSKGWRRNRLKTASGLTVDALGLDTGVRGAKDEERRPDMIIFDDVDEKHDTPKTVQKKIDILTTSILPAGSSDCAVLFIQNVIHDGSIADKLARDADFLIDRIVSGPIPAIAGLAYESYFDAAIGRNRYRISAGTPAWAGQDVATCEAQINEWGLTAFLQEAQHETTLKGGIWDHIEFRHVEQVAVPWGELVRGCVWCDPAVTSTDDSCANGIIADAIDGGGTIYRLYAWEGIDSPANVIRRAILKAIELGLQYVGIETNQGGDLWQTTFNNVLEQLQDQRKAQLQTEHGETWSAEYDKISWPYFREAKAGAGTGGKVERNQRMLADYERGQIVHVIGTHETLERALRRFPNEPLDLADAAYWGWDDLRNGNTWLLN